MNRKVLKTLNYKAGYQVRTEEQYMSSDRPKVVVRRAYTPEGIWIGTPRQAKDLIVRNGVKPELAEPGDEICTVGFQEKSQKWFGWSHRAICAFGIGDRLFDEFWAPADENTPFIRHGDVTIVNLAQARQAAVNFAESVS